MNKYELYACFILFTTLLIGCAPLGRLDPIEDYSMNTKPIFESDPGLNRMGDGAKRVAVGAVGDPVQAVVESIVGSVYFALAIPFGGPSDVAEAVTTIGVGVIRPFRGIGYVVIGMTEVFWGTGEWIGQLFPSSENEDRQKK